MSVFASESHGIKTEDYLPGFDGDPARGDLESLEALGLTRRQAEVAFWMPRGKRTTSWQLFSTRAVTEFLIMWRRF